MFGHKEYAAIALEEDTILIAHVRVKNKTLKLLKLDSHSLVEPLNKSGSTKNLSETASNASNTSAKSTTEEDTDDIFGFEDKDQNKDQNGLEELNMDEFETAEGEDDEMLSDMVEESTEVRSNELLMYEILNEIDRKKVRLGLNIPAGDAIFQIIRETDFNEVKRNDLVKDIENKLKSIYGDQISDDFYSYEIRDDGSLLLGSIEEAPSTLKMVNEGRELYSGKMVIEQIVPDEIGLVGLVRANYNLTPNEITCIVQLGKESCRLVFMKGQEIWIVSPLIDEGINGTSILNTIFSKILFQLDTGEVPDLDRIILANNMLGDTALESLRQKFPDVEVENLSYKDDFLDIEGIAASSIPAFTTVIASAYNASGLADEHLPPLNFVPMYVKERQKIFKLQWHGIAILVLIFLTPITLNYFYSGNARQIESMHTELNNIDGELTSVAPTVKRVNRVSTKLTAIKGKLTMLDSLVQGSKEWSVKLHQLNRGIQKVRSSWITFFSENKEGTHIQGYTLYRDRIPKIVSVFDDATLLSVNHKKKRDKEIFSFSILVNKFAASDSVYSPTPPQEVKALLNTQNK